MEELIKELNEIKDKLTPISNELENKKIKIPMEKLSEAANKIGKSWSNSFIGYQSLIYYRDFKEKPPGAHFSPEWGLIPSFSQGTTGDWVEYKFDFVIMVIEKMAENPDLTYFDKQHLIAKQAFNECKNDIISILKIFNKNISDEIISDIIDKISKLEIFSFEDFVKSKYPTQIGSRDSVAVNQGPQSPPHLNVLDNLMALSMPFHLCKELISYINKFLKHISRINKSQKYIMNKKGNKIFIGHGGSLIWRELKDFINEKLNLVCEEFNSVPVPGNSVIERLEEMLDNSCFAFLIMTAEDEQKDNSVRARENVVHEIGLFQGRLGFKKAIILLEDGCEKFSNIDGLIYISFPKGKIRSAFQDIRDVLERDNIL